VLTPTVLSRPRLFAREHSRRNALHYRHTIEDAHDMPSHIRAAPTQTHLSIPVIGGWLALETWQRIYLFEHRSVPQRRNVVVHSMS
jgi:secondary thiamine-phosphate synthase enzyme